MHVYYLAFGFYVEVVLKSRFNKMNFIVQNFITDKSGPKFQDIPIEYALLSTKLGLLHIAHNQFGICHLCFHKNQHESIDQLKCTWPDSPIKNTHLSDNLKHRILQFIDHLLIKPRLKTTPKKKLKIVLRGTNFQIQTWRQLIKIPFGTTSNYNQIANDLGKPKASRAIANAIARNPIAILIPCHRVIHKDGRLGGYRWGIENKSNLLKWENVKQSKTII